MSSPSLTVSGAAIDDSDSKLPVGSGPTAAESAPHSVGDILGRQRIGLLLSGVLSVLGAFCGLVPYVVVYLIARDLFVQDRVDRIGSFVAIAAIGVVGKALFRLIANTLSHRSAYRALADIRVALAERLGAMPLARARARSGGQIKKVFQDDVEQLELGLSHAIPDIAASVAVPFSIVAVMFWVDWRMALAGVAVIVCVLVCVAGAVTASKDLMSEESSAKTALNVSAVSFVRGIRVIRGFVGSERSYRGLHEAIEANERIENEKTARGRVGATIATSLTAISIVFILPLGLLLNYQGSLGVADLLFFLLVGVGFAQPLMSMTLSAAVLQYQVEAGLKNISEFLDEPDLPVVDKPETPRSSSVQLDDVSFGYGDEPVLANISMHIEEGERVALVGGSGAGKTTVLRLIARFLDVTAGTVRYGGVDVRRMAPATLARSIAFIQQDDYIFNDTIVENIRLARPDASDAEVRAAADRARVTAFVDDLESGFDTILGPGGGQLSGGQRQRISIARAFLADAPVIMLDEVTASLDVTNERAVVQALAELQRGRTVITVAHRLASLVEYDRIMVLDRGRIIAEGTHHALLADSPEYQQLWQDFVAVDAWQLPGGSTPTSRPPVGSSPVGSASGGGSSDQQHTPSPRERAGEPVHDRTPPVAGLGAMSAIRGWFAMLGVHRDQFWRIGLWRLLLEGFLTSASVIVVFIALLQVLDGSLDAADVAWLTGALWLLFLARCVIGVEVARKWWPIAGRAISDLRRSVVNRLMRTPLGVFDRMDAGRTSTLIVSDLALVDFINIPAKLVIACLQPIMVSIALFTLDWRLAAAALCGVPLFLLVAWLSDRRQGDVATDVAEALREANAALLEYSQGVGVLRAFPDAPQADRYRRRTEELRVASVRMAVRTGPLVALATVILEAGFVLLLWLGAAVFDSAEISAATLLLFLVIALNLYRPFQELLELSAYRHQQERIARSLGEVWDLAELSEPQQPAAPADSRVQLRSVGFSYGGDDVLCNVSFEAKPGTVTALVGPSGAGKSTVANLIARFWDPLSGTVALGGVDLRQLAPDTRRDLITTVYQDVYLFADTVRANLQIGNPDVSEAELWAALEAAEAADFVQKLPGGLDAELTESAGNLSGGQRQRLSIARALVKDAPVLLLDEAVASVDPATERRIQAALSRLVAGRTVLVIAHRLNTIQTADQIVVMDNGKVDAVGTHDELLVTSGTYRELQGVSG
ncbi:MAG: ABC transporter ATP-binding protein [Cumulibacter sp.]